MGTDIIQVTITIILRPLHILSPCVVTCGQRFSTTRSSRLQCLNQGLLACSGEITQPARNIVSNALR